MSWQRIRGFVAFAVALLLGVGAAVGEGRNNAPGRRPAGEEVTGVLESVDVEHGTFTLRRVGADVDDVLLEKMKERARGRGADADEKNRPEGGEGREAVVVSLAPKAEVYIKFRTSPSVANNAERTLEDLRPMVGWPVSLKAARRGDGLVAAEVIAWRGTPWKVARGEGEK